MNARLKIFLNRDKLMSCKNRFNLIFEIQNVQKIIWHVGCMTINQITNLIIKIAYRRDYQCS